MPSWALRQIVTSDEPPDRPLPVEPAIETYEGENLPYRGTELHGVPMFDEPRSTPAWHEGREVEHEEPEPEQEPVPVRVVNTSGRELRRCRVFRSYGPPVGKNPTQIVGRDEQRSSVKIKNLGDDEVWIAHAAVSASATHGWRLDMNQEFTSTTQDALWAMGSHATDETQLAVSIDYAVEEE